MTDYITTRWYRAPEVMTSWSEYTAAIDVWAAGCIFAEMLLGKPLFPGSDEAQQIELILATLGAEAEEQLMAMMQTDKLELFSSVTHDISSVKTLDELFGNHSPLALDLLKKMLVIDPLKRIDVEQALEHPFFAEFHDPEDEPVADPLHPYDFDFELYDLSADQLMELLYDEVMLYHDETALDSYIEDRALHPEGRTGERFGLAPSSELMRQLTASANADATASTAVAGQ